MNVLSDFILIFFLLIFLGKSHHSDGGFINPWLKEGEDQKTLRDLIRWQWDRNVKNRPKKPDSYDLKRIHPDSLNILRRVDDLRLTWVGHSTFLIQMENLNILTDPVWSDRVGPFNNRFGPKRMSEPGIPWEKLPPIDIAVISHNHYDHMDKATIKRLKEDFDPVFLVPLGNKKFLVKWGIEKIYELDWGENVEVKGLHIDCVPAQHFSQRWINDRNRSLWAGWVIKGKEKTIYFAGDTGYFPGFKEIAEKYDSIDAALLPIGAYEPRWFMKYVHLNPAEALQAFIDLEAGYFVATHWGTFDMTDEALDQPPKDLAAAADSLKLDTDRIWVFAFGETREIPRKKTE